MKAQFSIFTGLKRNCPHSTTTSDVEDTNCVTQKIPKKIIRKNLPKINFENCLIQQDTKLLNFSNKNMIQITANENEIERRVKSFIERKRDEIDLLNIHDFIDIKKLPSNLTDNDKNNDDSTMLCARVNSVAFKMKNSKGHLRVNRVKNEYGPQTIIDYKSELDKLMLDKNSESNIQIKQEIPLIAINKSGIDERLENIEDIFGIKSISKNIYERLKCIEDKLLYLEGVSPEYFNIKVNLVVFFSVYYLLIIYLFFF